MIWTGLGLSLFGLLLLTIEGFIWSSRWGFTIGSVLMFVGMTILVLSTEYSRRAAEPDRTAPLKTCQIWSLQ